MPVPTSKNCGLLSLVEYMQSGYIHPQQGMKIHVGSYSYTKVCHQSSNIKKLLVLRHVDIKKPYCMVESNVHRDGLRNKIGKYRKLSHRVEIKLQLFRVHILVSKQPERIDITSQWTTQGMQYWNGMHMTSFSNELTLQVPLLHAVT